MIRGLLRTIGLACILAGGILYLSNQIPKNDTAQLQQELKDVKAELQRTKKELALAQTVSSKEEQAPKELPVAKQPKQEEAKQPAPVETTVVTKTISVSPGSSSADLAATLERAQLIDSAKKFDNYLKDHGYASKIQIGSYSLSSDMNFQKMADILTNSN